jgi:hypothetical protein
MSITLPSSPGIRSAKPRLLDFGGVQTPPGGGASQKLYRLGDRYALAPTMPPIRTEPDGRIWASKLIQAQREGAIFAFPQPDLVIGDPGSPVVDGAGQAGMVLNLRGFTAGYLVRDGQFFSIIHGGRRYLHCARGDLAADGTGKISLPIQPMLRIAPADGAVCEFAAPKIEGLLDGQAVEWEHQLEPYTLVNFSITESE